MQHKIFADNCDNLIEEYRLNGKLHRENGPAYIEWGKNGTIIEIYYEHGKKHREDGPAYIGKNSDGQKIYLYYRNDIQINPPRSPIRNNTINVYIVIQNHCSP